MKKSFSVILLFGFLSLLIGCGNEINKTSLGKFSIDKTLNIGLNADTAGIDDKGFNNSAYEGLIQGKDKLNIKYSVLESKSVKSYEENIKNLAKKNSLIFGMGFRMKDSIENIAKKNVNKSFVLIDNISDLANVKSITFKEEEGAFLMGIIAGDMTKTNKVGFIGGAQDEVIQKLEAGFTYGVNKVNKDAALDLMDKSNVKYTMDFDNEEKGYKAAKELYNSGVDIIFHGAGKCGAGVFRAAKEEGKYAIGIDEDQSEKFPEYSDFIISSMIKRTDLAVYETIEEFIKDTFKSGKDNVSELGIKEKAIDVAESTKNKVPKNILDEVNRYKDLIENGDIKIPKTTSELVNN